MVSKERTPLDTPYLRDWRVSCLEDVKIEQDLGRGTNVDMLNAKQVGFSTCPVMRS
jgi:hypothetical protein